MSQDHGLEIDQNLAYHRCFWKVQRIGWVLGALILLAAMIGLLGPGLKGRKTLRDESSQLSLTYERFIRYQAPAETQIAILEAATTDSNSRLSDSRLSLNRACLESLELVRIDPAFLK